AGVPIRGVSVKAPDMVTVGRVTPIKHIEVIIGAVAKLRERGIRAHLDILGDATVPSDSAYEKRLRGDVQTLGLSEQINFKRSVEHVSMPQTLAQYDIAVNAAPTGGIDKVVLEAMAAGLASFAANEGFKEYFGDLADTFMYSFNDANDL